MRNYKEYVERKTKEFAEKGMKFDTSELSEKFIPYFESGQRIIVETKFRWFARGYVGVTTGWKPSFLLVSRKGARGSSILLSDNYEIVGTVNKFWER